MAAGETPEVTGVGRSGTLAGPSAIRGGEPAFPEGLPVARPAVPAADGVAADVGRILESRKLTNGPFVRELERAVGDYLGVSHCVAVSSCTAGLMLLLGSPGEGDEVVLPSFTFSATAHAVAWNGLRPVFADVDRDTLTLSAAAVERRLTPRTRAILATHVFGTPCEVDALGQLASSRGIRLFFDAAHALGSRHQDVPLGAFGDAEVFSLTPTKVLVAGEGGLVCTEDDELAERCRVGREYGNPGDYDTRFVGLNARMSEFHAAIALRSLDGLEDRIARRNELADGYREALGDVPGLSFPAVRKGDRSTYKDLTVLVEGDSFGIDAPCLAKALAAEGVETRRYYSPPVHVQRAYRSLVSADTDDLSVTGWAAERVITLPLWEEMTEGQVLLVADAIRRIRSFPPAAETCAGTSAGT